MPDPILIVTAMGVALTVSAVLPAMIGWLRCLASTTLSDAGWILGIGIGFFVGCWVLGIRPHIPPREDLDRLLVMVLPATVAIELLAAFPQVPRWLIWPLRFALVAGIARVLLHGTSYITDLTGPGTSEWPPSLTWLIFGSLAAIQAAVWVSLSILAQRAPGPSLPICLAVTSAGAAVTIMLSGYATGGQVGLPLAAALMGAMAAMLVLTRATRGTGPLGVPITGLFSLLVIGRFFGELTSAHAIMLFCAPLLCWLPELRYLRRLPSWARGLARVILVGFVVSAVLVRAQRKFDHDLQSTSSGSRANEPSIQDYLNLEK